jgi:hypothetical protein
MPPDERCMQYVLGYQSLLCRLFERASKLEALCCTGVTPIIFGSRSHAHAFVTKLYLLDLLDWSSVVRRTRRGADESLVLRFFTLGSAAGLGQVP